MINRIMAERMRAIPLADNQRGFTSIDGCFANNITVQTIIKNKRRHSKGIAMITLDLRKVLDTVSHNSVKRALKRFRLDDKTTNYIMEKK